MGCEVSKESKSKEVAPNREEKKTESLPSRVSSTYQGVKLYSREDFVVEKFIQEGGQGKVHVGKNEKENKYCALKFFGYTSRRPNIREINAEISLMKDLQGIEGMVQMYGVFMDTQIGMLPRKCVANELPVIVMELLEGGELFERIADHQTFSEKNMAKIFKGIVLALDSVHSRGYIHRDIKLENLMMVTPADDSPVKVIDFGMMVKLHEGHKVYNGTSAVGSPGYIAPESIINHQYSSASDLWQVGCTLYSLLSGLLPFHPQDYRQITQRTYYPMTGVGWEKISDSAKDLVAKILRKRPEKRLTVKEILKHPWVVSEAPDEDLGADYFTRLKHLALRQRLKAFFNDSNIEEDNNARRTNLKNVLPMLHMNNKEFDGKIKLLKTHMVESLRTESKDFQEPRGNVPPGEIGYDEFCAILEKAGLPEMKSPVVFNIFDTGSTGSVDMKDFLLTMIAFRPEPSKEEMKKVNGAIDVTLCHSQSDINEDDNKPNPILEAEQRYSLLDDQCRLYFNIFDVNETGYIDIEELKLVVSSLLQEGRPVSSQLLGDDKSLPRKDSNGEVYQSIPGMNNIEELFQIIDVDNTGQISFEEFQKFYDAVLTFSTRRSVL